MIHTIIALFVSHGLVLGAGAYLHYKYGATLAADAAKLAARLK